MPDFSFRPLPGRYGTQVEVLGKDFGVAPFVVNVTTVFSQQTPPSKCAFARAYVCTANVPSDADGTLVVRLFKRAAGGTRTQLTADYNIEGNTAREKKALVMVAGLSDAARTLLEVGDAYEWDLISNSAAIDTQPTLMWGVVESFILQ